MLRCYKIETNCYYIVIAPTAAHALVVWSESKLRDHDADLLVELDSGISVTDISDDQELMVCGIPLISLVAERRMGNPRLLHTFRGW